MNDALISVIVPVYNVEPYLKTCIESIIHQQYAKLEIILVDDGSTDRSGDMCDEYAKLDERIVVVHKQNGGLSDARNVGMQYAHGQLFGFVDSDDWIDPNMYLELYNAMVQYNSEISICSKVSAYGDRCDYDEGDGTIHLLNQHSALELLLTDPRCQSFAWNKLYKKEVFSNILFPVGKYYEDHYIMHIVFENAQKVTFIEKSLYYYRQRDDSIVHRKDIRPWFDHMEATKLRYDHYRDDEQFSILVAKNMLWSQCITLDLINLLKPGGKEKKEMLTLMNQYYTAICKKNLAQLPIQLVIKRRLLLTAPFIVSLIRKLIHMKIL